jgi:hypothetical protein
LFELTCIPLTIQEKASVGEFEDYSRETNLTDINSIQDETVDYTPKKRKVECDMLQVDAEMSSTKVPKLEK